MKLVRILSAGGPVWAAEVDGGYRRVTWVEGTPSLTADVVEAGNLLPPVDPPAILAIGLNYRQHAAETGAQIPAFPVVFAKGLNALAASGDPIVLPRHLRSDKVDFECELAFVIKQDAKNVSRDQAMDYVLGFTAANDVSARDWQKEWGGGQWGRAKSFDTFCPIGPRLVTLDELPNYGDLGITTRVNGVAMQDGRTNDLIFDIPALIEFLSGSTTLLAGTVVLTGTPHGVGMARTPPVWLQPGDVVEVEIEGIGVLRNPVLEESV
jgi:2-keto-4-pentenoate hydratase/2-oxohepta-3-ene-1,7-dioic acid hydratase in catechol pathway